MRFGIKDLEQYLPYNEQEEKDRERMIDYFRKEAHLFDRSNLHAHMTASAWVVNNEHTKVLMAYHNLYDSWAWLGGHADGCEDLLAVAIKEVQEESGLQELKPLSVQPLSIEILTVNGHFKHGVYVSSHLHLNVTYLLEADETTSLKVKPDENKAVDWFSPEEAIAHSTEAWFQNNVYNKLNEKMKRYL